MQRRLPRLVPDFGGCPWPRHGVAEAERSAQILFAYFHPWCLAAEHADDLAPLLGDLRGDAPSWSAALEAWFARGALHEEARRHLASFLNVIAARPPDEEEQEGDSEAANRAVRVELPLPPQWLPLARGAGPERTCARPRLLHRWASRHC